MTGDGKRVGRGEAETKAAILGGNADQRQGLLAKLETAGARVVYHGADVTGLESEPSDILEFLFLIPDTTSALPVELDGPKPYSIVVLDDVSSDSATDVIRRGARGVIQPEIEPTALARLIVCVRKGELWATRDVLESIFETARTDRRLGPIEAGDAGRPSTFGAPEAVGESFGLTAREREIVRNVVEGRTNREIARIFSISENTVKFHLRGVYDKTGVHNRLELAVFAAQHALVPHSDSERR